MADAQHTVSGLMALVSEYGQCRWSEGSSGATYLDRVGERRSREEAAELYQQIEAYAKELAIGVQPRCAHCLGGSCIGTNFAPPDAYCQQGNAGVDAAPKAVDGGM